MEREIERDRERREGFTAIQAGRLTDRQTDSQKGRKRPRKKCLVKPAERERVTKIIVHEFIFRKQTLNVFEIFKRFLFNSYSSNFQTKNYS